MGKIEDFAAALNQELSLKYNAVVCPEGVKLYIDENSSEPIFIFYEEEIESDYKVYVDLLMVLLDVWEE